MSKWSDSAELLQKLITAKEVIPIQGDLINLQQTMFVLQTDQMKLIDENQKLKDELAKLKQKKKYIVEPGHSWVVDPEKPEVKLCPVCLNRDGFENPLDDYDDDEMRCSICKNYRT